MVGHKVEKIEQGKKVKITCQAGSVFGGDHIICTIPTFSAKKINWQPVLPPDVKLAMNELQYARINKNAMLYSERFWKDESYDLVTDTPGHYFTMPPKTSHQKKEYSYLTPLAIKPL